VTPSILTCKFTKLQHAASVIIHICEELEVGERRIREVAAGVVWCVKVITAAVVVVEGSSDV
jgi:hypothetical protein